MFSTTFLAALNLNNFRFSKRVNLEEQLEQYKLELNNKISSLQSIHNKQISEIKNFKQNQNLLKTISLKELETKINNLENQKQKAILDIDQNNQELIANQNRLAFLTNFKNDYSKKIVELERTKNNNLKEIEQINLEINKLQIEINLLNDQILNNNQTLVNLKNKNNDLKILTTDFEKEITNNNSQIRNTK
ncbi:hypothetical protein [Mycoplasma capricolum]|uniref:Uncharacterized protein n=1 Tax=Mycoplasma capricolum subsp. capripneumoniae 87001 TaxID=1124992 RepID=A0A9N7G8C4_MYCCC|nr:hypothetical protein [Mycoplasma capricolum]AJK51277.1 hypothetical protein MCCG_0295 [Mycoplasma capricolum subsp. capripneumoniae 87001]UVO25031.1 hypothetical protein zly1402F_01470 [Mycoplasma capricolum subsp. capripneumoniae]